MFIEIMFALGPTLVMLLLILLVVKGSDRVSLVAGFLMGSIVDLLTFSWVSFYRRNVSMYRYIRG